MTLDQLHQQAGAADERLETLLDGICQGDEHALQGFYQATADRLLTRLIPLVDGAHRENVLVTTYVEVWRSAALQRPRGLEVMGWLLRLALVPYLTESFVCTHARDEGEPQEPRRPRT